MKNYFRNYFRNIFKDFWEVNFYILGWGTVGGMMMTMSFPPVYLWPLSIVGYVLISYFFASQSFSRKQAFLLFFVFAFMTRLSGLYWIPHTLIEFSAFPLGVAWALGLLGFVLMSIPSGLWAAFGPALLRKLSFGYLGKPQSSVLTVFFFWLIWDILDLRLFGWFPAQSFGAQKQLLASAGILGSWGWTAIFYALVSFSTYWLFNKKIKVALLYSAAAWTLTLLVAAGLGEYQIRKLQAKFAKRQPIAMLQGNVGNFEKKIQHLNEEPTHEVVLGIYRDLIEAVAIRRQTQNLGEVFVFWPETAFPGFPMNDSPLSELLSSWARLSKGFHLIGAYEESAVTVNKKIQMLDYNIVTSYDRDGNFRGHYRKVKRMPFGEYVPGDEYYPWIYEKFSFLNHFGRGERPVAIAHPDPQGPVFLPFICFETLQESYVRESVEEAQKNYPGRDIVFVNPTNDSWFGHGAELFFHSRLAIWQAAREGRPLVRATNTGISMVVAPWGEVLSQGRTQVQEYQMAELPVSYVVGP